MYQTLDFNDFRDAFEKQRPDSFSYDGLQILFDYLEDEYPDYELDVIELDGIYNELCHNDFILSSSYDYITQSYFDDFVEENGESDKDGIEYSYADLDIESIIRENFNVIGDNDDCYVVVNE